MKKLLVALGCCVLAVGVGAGCKVTQRVGDVDDADVDANGVDAADVDADSSDDPPCQIYGYSPDDPFQGLYFAYTFNIMTDGDSFTPGMQTQVRILTDSTVVWKVGVRVTSLADNQSQEYYVENIAGDEILVGTSPISLPEGDVLIEPLCVRTGEIDPFGYPNQSQQVYVDTVRPECPTDLSCQVGSSFCGELNCDWTTSDDPGAFPDIERWDLRFTTAYANQADCNEINLNGLWPTLDPLLPDAPPGNYLDPINHRFNDLHLGLFYCIGMTPIDYAGNPAECISPFWVGEFQFRYTNLEYCVQPPCGFGSAVASADVNCDGYSDLVVGARGVEAGGASFMADGEAYIYFGGTSGIQNNASPDVIITPAQPDGVFGWAMTGLGNFTGHTNNCQDFAISAQTRNNGDTGCTWGECNSGAVYIFKGKANWNANIVDENADAIVFYNASGRHGLESFGYDVVVAGDFDNDGRPDMAISAMLDEDRGAVYVMRGQDIPYSTGAPMLFGVPADMDLKMVGNSDVSTYCPLEELGASLGPAGDLDEDGHDDLLVGAPGHDLVCPSDGKAYILFGGSFGASMDVIDVLNPGNRVTVLSPDSHGNITGNESLGFAVAGLGDINGDGYLDLAVSDPDYDASPLVDSGAFFVFFGDSSGFRGTARVIEVDEAGWWIRSTEAFGDRFGIDVASSVEVLGTAPGDICEDGLTDLLMSTERYGVFGGSVFLLYGSTSLAPIYTWINWNAASFRPPPPGPGGWGSVVRYIGDTNGDGHVEFAVGGQLTLAGSVTVVY